MPAALSGGVSPCAQIAEHIRFGRGSSPSDASVRTTEEWRVEGQYFRAGEEALKAACGGKEGNFIEMRRKKRGGFEVATTVKRWCYMFVMIFLVSPGEGFPKEWNGIVPCVSTRWHVQMVLGKETIPSREGQFGIYRYKKVRVRIKYREAENDDKKDVVESIDVDPDKSITLVKYIRNIPNFQRDFLKTSLDDSVTHVYGRAVYRNWKEGFEIWVQKNEDDLEAVTSFGYFDPKYSCSKILPAEPELESDSFQRIKQ